MIEDLCVESKSAMVVKDRETQFLRSRALRLEQKNDNDTGRRKREESKAFWDKFRQEVRAWQGRLDCLVQTAEANHRQHKDDELIGGSSKAEKRRIKIRTSLAQLQTDLDQLRKQCLSSTPGAKLENAWEVPRDLPATDVRILHTELTRCATDLEQARSTLQPRARFSFRRYREARGLQQEQPESHAEEQSKRSPSLTQNNSTKSSSSKSKKLIPSTEMQYNNNVLEGLHLSKILVSKDGDVSIQSDEGGNIDETHSQHKNIPCFAGKSFIVLRDIQNSDLMLHNTVKEIHLVNVSRCTIHITCEPISGAVHITNCHKVEFFLRAFHQMRIHDSTELRMRIKDASISGGTILEDCFNVTFIIPDNNGSSQYDNTIEKLLDVKDFNWLRNGIPSPNFRVLIKDQAEVLDKEEAAACIKSIEAPESSFRPTDIEAPTERQGDNQPAMSPLQAVQQEDSDDEL